MAIKKPAPEDFGLMGIAFLSMSALETFSQTGFHQALIQKKEDIQEYLDTAWTVLIIRGVVLFAILYLIAPFVASFFNVPQASLIIRVIGFSVLFQAFTNIGIIYLQKELEFNKEFMYQFVGTLADFIVAISAVLILRSVWALVFGLIAGSMARCFVSYLIHSYRPRFNFDVAKVKELFGFGKWVFGSSILIFLITQGDDIFVGKLLGATALGFYQMAYKISNLPATEITHMISRVTFPAYSKLQDSVPKLREAYLKVLQITAFLSFPMAGLIFVLAPDFTKLFLGEKWMPMVPAMMVLCVFGAARSVTSSCGALFQGVGRPDFIAKASLIKLVCLIIVIYPLAQKWNITGVALAITLPTLISQTYVILHILDILKCRKYSFLKTLFFPAAGTVIMLAGLFSFRLIFQSELTLIAFSVLAGLIIYLGFLVGVSKIIKGYDLFQNIMRHLKKSVK